MTIECPACLARFEVALVPAADPVDIGCEHGRLVGVPCPHCLGHNEVAARQRASEACPHGFARGLVSGLDGSPQPDDAVQDAYDLGYQRGHRAGLLEGTVGQLIGETEHGDKATHDITYGGMPERAGELAALRRLGVAVLDYWAAKDGLRAVHGDDQVSWARVRTAHAAWSETLATGPSHHLTANPSHPRWTVSVYLTRAGRVLLVRHKRLAMWLPVGGGIETGERPIEAVVREAREETGFDLSDHGHLGYDEHHTGERLHLNHAFWAEVKGSAHPFSDGSWSDYQWIRIGDEPPEGTPGNVRVSLRQLAKRENIPEPGRGLTGERPYACLTCGDAIVASGMCERCSRAWGMGCDHAETATPNARPRTETPRSAAIDERECATCGDVPCEHFRAMVGQLDAEIRALHEKPVKREVKP